jgi:tRNA pseudouridine55 synthase
MNGFLIINKEPEMTSHDVVNKIRKIFQTKQVGHTGTLDPNATGVLIVAVGKATKVISYLENDDKIYQAELTLGITTDTEDIWGNVIEQKEINVTEEEIKQVIKSFIGNIKQVPPMYSALKVNGKKLYELAREGIEVKREPRKIEIFNIYDIEVNKEKVSFTVHCSKGTYIRTLCKDIGEKLLCGATMSKLERIKAGSLEIKNSVKLSDLEVGPDKYLINLENILEKFPIIYLEAEEAKKYVNGIKFPINKEDGMYRVYIENSLYGIAKVEDGNIKSEKRIS